MDKPGKSKNFIGFTLIELLVVISIIALLISILMPALNLARDQAKGAMCLANHRSMSQAYLMYTHDNEDRLPRSDVWADTPESWVRPPTAEDGSYLGAANALPTIDDRHRGIRNGVIYPYCENVDVYHCPADTRDIRGTNLGNDLSKQMFRSYGIQGGLNGEELNNSGINVTPRKMGKVKNTAETYVFVEESYDGQWCNYNGGSWMIDVSNNGISWWNIMSIWHNKKSTLGFADGHAEMMKWVDERTFIYAADRTAISPTQTNPDNPDLVFMIRGYAVPLPR
ncbi:MAG: prepilin-type N-terminal cleavage/methylation domain-containing protein [Sedimentisphaerales bacterium]|nr:prepilin-type N-terminal cleavage/methylation domain-containing protein [Sedimentisphaerales bacterium]